MYAVLRCGLKKVYAMPMQRSVTAGQDTELPVGRLFCISEYAMHGQCYTTDHQLSTSLHSQTEKFQSPVIRAVTSTRATRVARRLEIQILYSKLGYSTVSHKTQDGN